MNVLSPPLADWPSLIEVCLIHILGVATLS
jgi:hypothetical protein